MSIHSTTYICDWPGCGDEIVDPQSYPNFLSDRNWEHRSEGGHVCPVHRFKSSEELLEALEEKDDNVYYNEIAEQIIVLLHEEGAYLYDEDGSHALSWDKDNVERYEQAISKLLKEKFDGF